jgi:hypothetical protein
MVIERITRNTHILENYSTNKHHQLAVLSDLHWDNPKTDRKQLKRHLDYCLENKIPVFVNGDFFCMMQGKYDPRRSKKDILQEHNVANYIDAVIEDAVEWFTPYASILAIIGYGNHECYRPDTEVLTNKGWVKISEMDQTELVAQFDSETITYVKPLDYLVKKVDGLISIEGNYTKQIVSKKHAVVLDDMSKVNAEDLQPIKENLLPTKRIFKSKGVNFSNEYVELLTAIVMDGTIVDERKTGKSNKARIQIKVSKPSKIEYFTNLLKDIPHTFREAKISGVNVLQPYYFTIYSDHARQIIDDLGGQKKLPNWFKDLNQDQFEFVLNALINTDAHIEKSNTIEWRSIDKQNIDIMQIACIHNGYLMAYSERDNLSGFSNGKKQYLARIKKEISNKKTLDIRNQEYSGDVYCLSMPLKNFITRIDGKIAFSGNTAIIKNLETDPLQRFVDLFRYKNKDSQLQAGGYGGWIMYRCKYSGSDMAMRTAIRYFHGSGGGGVVTRGEINLTRALEMYEGMDVFVMGHIHENKATTVVRDTFGYNSGKQVYEQKQKEIHLMVTGTYKEEYQDGYGGWHVERGAPVKPTGGRILNLYTIREQVNKSSSYYVKIDSQQFPM